MKQLFIYDLDGTLVDTREDIVLAVQAMMRHLGRPVRAEAEICRHVGLGLRHLVGACLGDGDAESVERGLSWCRTYYGEHLLDHSRLYDGALDMLNAFRRRRQALVTNKPEPFVGQILRGLSIDRYFHEVIAGDVLRYAPKPDPEACLALMARFGVTPDDTVLIGDSPIDVQTGRRAGIHTAALTHGFSERRALEAAGPDVLADSFAELLEAAGQRHW